ncbi:TPA: hypothetical protein HL324_07805 [Escherichia coli]|nr:hypothetical protein [Escherichia coli]
MSIKNDGHYFCRAGGNRPDGLNEPVTHEGSMTSIHAGSAKEAIDGFITRCYENPQCAQLPYTFMLRKVLDSLDVIVSIDLDGNVRRMNDIYFRPIHRNQYFEEMKA